MAREITGVSVEGQLIPLSGLQIDILKHLGKGLSRKQTANELNLPDKEFGRTLKEVFGILEVDGEVPAVMQTLKRGDLDIRDLVDPDFDLKQFSRLTRNERIVLDLLVESKSTTLDKKVLEEADIETSQETSQYVTTVLRKIYSEKVGFGSRMQLLVHYYAFLNRPKEELPLRQTESNEGSNDTLVLTPRERKVLELSGLKRPHRLIARNLGVNKNAVLTYLDNACKKLGASSVEAAIAKARELGIIKS